MRAPVETVTSAEKPCSARSASTVSPTAKRAGMRGEPHQRPHGGPLVNEQESVRLSTRVVIVSASTGSSAIGSIRSRRASISGCGWQRLPPRAGSVGAARA